MNNLILIKNKFSERYTLTIESETKAINVKMKSTARIRWDFRVLKVEQDYIECELLMLENILLESNNPLVQEISELSQAFGRMYNELHFKMDNNGKIVEILNIDLLLSKWNDTKEQMLKASNVNKDIENIISLNDHTFANPKKLIKAIQGSEFFVVLFNDFYGKSVTEKNRIIEKPNFFNTAMLYWDFSILANKQFIQSRPSENIKFETNAIPSGPLERSFYQKAYKSFEDYIDLKKLSTSLVENGNYLINPHSGKILKANLARNEILDSEKVYTKLNYKLDSDSNSNIKKEIVESTQKITSKDRINILDL